MSESGRSPLSLRHRLLLAGGLFSVLITAATAALVLVSWRLHDDLERATGSFLEEQRIAEQMHGAVMRQLAMASAFPGARDGSVQAEFLDAGMEVDRLMRLYLSRDLDSEERLQLERVRTEHQRLEVAAIRAGGQYRRGLEESGEASMTRVVLHSGAFIDAVNAFLELRSSDDELQQRQDRMFALLYLVGTMVAGLALLATFGLFWTIQRRVARPLAELATATQRMAAGD